MRAQDLQGNAKRNSVSRVIRVSRDAGHSTQCLEIILYKRMHLFILQFFKTGFDLFERKTGTVVPLNEKKKCTILTQSLLDWVSKKWSKARTPSLYDIAQKHRKFDGVQQ